jgi:hypothetical protein
MKVIMPLNTWANMCGHFFNCCLTPGFEDKPDVNNGYNCDHPEAEEQYGIGCCFAHSCPLAYRADGLDCKRFGIECEDCGNEECECSYHEMMVCEISNEQYNKRRMYRETATEE